MYKQKRFSRLLFFASILFLLITIRVSGQTPFVPNCNGIDDTLEFTTLINGAAGNPRTIRIPYYDDLNKRCKVTTMTVPAHITLDNTDGIGIAVDSPNVLTVSGPIVNPVGKILFFGSGTTSLAGNTFVGANGQARLSNGAGVDTWGIPVGTVSEMRTINTSGPLSGGGDLSANRTITCDTCALTTNTLSQFAASSSEQFASLLTNETGSGAAVFNIAPVFNTNITTPTIYGGQAPNSGLILSGSSDPTAQGSHVQVNPQIIPGISPGGLFVGAPISSMVNNPIISDQLHLQGGNGKVTAMVMDSYGPFSPQIIGRAAGGTAQVPTQTAADQLLAVLAGRGYEPDTPGFTGNIGYFTIRAAEPITATGKGTYMSFFTTPIGTTTIGERMRLSAGGDLLLGTTNNPTANSGKVMVFGDNGASNPTMSVNTAGLFARKVSGLSKLFAIDEDGTAIQLTASESTVNKSPDTSLGTSDALYPTQNAVKTYVDALIPGYTTENAANKSTSTALGTSNVLYPSQNAVKTYVDARIPGYTAENAANKSTSPSLGTSDVLYPSQNAVKQYVDNHAPGSGPFPVGNEGDLQMKSGSGLAASGINDDGSLLSFNRPVQFAQSDNGFARWTFNDNNSLSLAATLAAPTAPAASPLSDATGNCTAGTHQFKVTYLTPAGETNASTPSAVVTCSASQTKVTITLPTGSTTNGLNTIATGRNIYATKAGGSIYFLIAPSPVVNNNTSTTYTFSIADNSFLAPQAPTTNTAVDGRIYVDNLGNVGFGTTQPQFTDDSQGRSVAIDGGTAEGYLGIGTTSVTNPIGRVGALNFYNIAQGGVDHRVAAIFAFNDGALGKGSLVFSTSAGIIGPSGAGSINSEQNWGIGRTAVSGVKLIVQAADTSPANRAFSVNNSIGSAAFLNIWNDGKVQFSNGSLQVDSGPFRVSSTGEVTASSLTLTSAAKPACGATNRGEMWYVAGGAGVKDTVEICAKDAADVFAWRVLY